MAFMFFIGHQVRLVAKMAACLELTLVTFDFADYEYEVFQAKTMTHTCIHFLQVSSPVLKKKELT